MESKYFLKSLKSDNWPVYGLAISPDGKFFVSGIEKEVKKWDLINRTWKVLLRGAESTFGVTISPNSKLICASSFISVILLDLAGNVIRTFEGHTDDVLSVAFSPDGLTICSCDERFVKTWDVKTGTCLNTIDADPDEDSTGVDLKIAFSPDGKTICTANPMLGLDLWNTLTGEKINHFLETSRNGAFCVAFSPDGKMVCSGSGDVFKVQLYKTETGELIKEFTGHEGTIRCVAFSPDGKWICSGSDDKTVRLWSLIGEDPIVLTGHKRGISCVAFSPKKDIILSGSSDGEIIMWANPEVTQNDRTAPIFSQLLGIDLMKPTGDTRSDPLPGNLQRLPPELRSLIAGYLPLKDII